MTNIEVNKIIITSEQTQIYINGSGLFMDLFSISQLMKLVDQKEVQIISRIFHSHNDYVSFENNFLLKLYRLLENINHAYDFNAREGFDSNFWLLKSIEKIKKNLSSYVSYRIEDNNSDLILVATIKNLKGEKLLDD